MGVEEFLQWSHIGLLEDEAKRDGCDWAETRHLLMACVRQARFLDSCPPITEDETLLDRVRGALGYRFAERPATYKFRGFDRRLLEAIQWATVYYDPREPVANSAFVGTMDVTYFVDYCLVYEECAVRALAAGPEVRDALRRGATGAPPHPPERRQARTEAHLRNLERSRLVEESLRNWKGG